MMRRFPMRARRRGVTLLELLVVASIMLTLAAVSVPTIKPMMESQQTSNAAAAVSTYLNRARTRAMATGRSCGVTFEFFEGTWDELDPDDPDDDIGSACVILRQVETPPYYTGLDMDANVTVLADTDGDGFVDDSVVLDPDSPYYGMSMRALTPIDPYWTKFILDEKFPAIQFNSDGPYYPIFTVRDVVNPDNSSYFIVKLPGLELPSRLNVSFKVRRDPRPTMTAPIGLTQGTVVDLEYSGWGEGEFDCFALGADVTVMFSPSGEVEYVQDGYGTHIPTEMLYFLIGRWDRISIFGSDEFGYSLTEDGLWNYEDGSNFWVTINPRTGLVSTAEVNPPVNYTAGDFFSQIEESREFGRISKRNLGGH